MFVVILVVICYRIFINLFLQCKLDLSIMTDRQTIVVNIINGLTVTRPDLLSIVTHINITHINVIGGI